MNFKSTVLDYFRLMSPGITLLVLLTAFTGMWIGSKGTNMEIQPVFWSLLGLGLAASGACILNNWSDRDIDRLMERTRNRPLPSGRLDPATVLWFGLILLAISFVILSVFGNSLSTFLTIFAVMTYSWLYTALLKKRTPWATLIGGISGALPPVIGWTLVRGNIGIEALLLFGILFFWQPPHFWSLAVKYRQDYIDAGIPCLPAVRSIGEVSKSCMIYISALLIFSILPYIKGMAGGLYLIAASILGAIFLILPWLDFRRQKGTGMGVFAYSIIYIIILFGFMIIDYS